MRFIKMHGLGNDFVVFVDAEVPPDVVERARRVCDRHFGVGADGLVYLLPSAGADLRMRVFNPDGSEAEMCGNAIRCVAKYAYENGLSDKQQLRVETGAGVLVPRLELKDGKVTRIEVDMGEPILERGLIPVIGPPGRVVAETLTVDGQVFEITAVSFGNPHCVVFVPDVSSVKLNVTGPQIEHNPVFPRRTNVEFVQVLGRDALRVRVWERGAGETLACGTGACASAVASFLNGLTGRKVTVVLPGGDLMVTWSEDNHVYMAGPAAEVFRGDWPS